MPRTLLCCAVLVFFAAPLRAEQTVTATETLIRLTVYPRAAPKPALRYLLLPDLREQHPGNPIPVYLKVALVSENSPDRETIGSAALREADRAARLDKPDWQILLKAKTDGIGLLLPDVQKMRAVAAALQERFREENAQQRVEDALRTAKTMFALSRHMGEHPTLIGDLVGMAIAAITIGPLEEMLELPAAPNLYWALTNLPSPFIPLDKGMEGERLLIGAELRDLDEKAPMSAAQLNKLIAHIDKLREFDGKKEKARAWLNGRDRSEAGLRAVRERLVEVGCAEEVLRRFPVDQLLLLDEKRAYEVSRDETMKLMKLPAWQYEKLAGPDKPAKDEGLFGFLVPAVIKIRRAQARLEQRIALLRHVEALRLYAAAHDGKLPAKLADCPVPLPDDPITGKPFRYEVEGITAHLRGGAPPGQEKIPAFNLHYQITIRK